MDGRQLRRGDALCEQLFPDSGNFTAAADHAGIGGIPVMEHPAQGFTIGGVTEGGHHIVGAGRQGHFGQGGAEIFQGDEVIGSGNGGADLILTSGIQQGGGKARQPGRPQKGQAPHGHPRP